MSEFGKIEEITDDLKKYINTNYEIIKLTATERASVVGSGLLSSLFIGLIGCMFLFVLSLGAGYYLSVLLGDTYSGFILLAGFYLLVWIILIFGKKKLLEKPFRDKIIEKLLEIHKPPENNP